MNLKSRVCIVTGAGHGLGRCIAQTVAQNGARVALCDIDEQSISKVADDINQSGDEAIAIRANITIWNDVERIVHEVKNEFGTVNILVNNAGILQVAQIEEISSDDWDHVLAVNLKGAFLCAKAVMPILKEKREGTIINISSIGGKIGGISAGANYCASKAGVISLTKSLAKQLASFKVTANCIAPGPLDTEMFQSYSPEQKKNIISHIPLGRIIQPQSVANMVVFLASDLAKDITGEIIDIDGGMTMD